MSIVTTIGISILSVFLLFILKKKGKLMSDYMLIATISLIIGLFISEFWVRQGLTKTNFIVEKSISFYILPVFLTYAMLLISEGNRISRSWWWFGSFALAFTVFIIVDFTFLTDYDSESLLEEYQNGSAKYHFFYRGSNIFAILALLWLLKRLSRYRVKIKDNYSFIDKINLTWLSNFVLIYIMNNVLILLVSAIFSFLHVGDLDLVYLIIFISIVLSLFYLCYNGIRQYSILEYNAQAGSGNLQSVVVKEKTSENPKYQTSSFSNDDMDILFEKIVGLLEQEKIYLDPELKILHLGEKLQSTTHNVSQTINIKAGRSFYDFVNNYRVNHLKSLLVDPENRRFTILGLGYDSGFNSKSTINRIFKRQVGITPQEYQREHLTKT